MSSHKHELAGKEIKSVTHLAIFTNIGLFVVKFLVGYVSGSMALIADGIHSISDTTTDFAVLLGHYVGSKEPDPSHPYGHGRFETFSAGLIALFLAVVGCGMIYYAALDIAKANVSHPGTAVLAVAVFAVGVKELLYRITKRTAVRTHSSALYANAWHQRSDALSSIAVIIGFAALKFGFDYGDQVATIAVGIMIILVGVGIVGESLQELTEGAIDQETIDHVKQIINANDQIRRWHQLRTRTVGREVFLDLHILVDPELNVTQAHEISESLERALDEQISQPVNITIHIEPDIPELRK